MSAARQLVPLQMVVSLTAVLWSVPVWGGQPIVPGTGIKATQVGDDFEDPQWEYLSRDPKSSREMDEQARLQLGRAPFAPPAMRLNPAVRSIFDFDYADFELVDYQSHPRITAPIAV